MTGCDETLRIESRSFDRKLSRRIVRSVPQKKEKGKPKVTGPVRGQISFVRVRFRDWDLSLCI